MLKVLDLTLFSVLVSSQKPVDPKATKETICLYKNLYELQSTRNVIFGHHHDNVQGQHFYDNNGLHNESDILFGISQYSGFIEYNLQLILNGKNFTEHILHAIDMGLMVGFHFEADNPVTGGNDKDTSGNPVVELMPGGKGNKQWLTMLDEIAQFIKPLTFDNGNPIPFVFRLFHECLGNWYWWGQNYCSRQEYINAFNYTRNYLLNTHDLHNILYVYAPNKPYSKYGNNITMYGNDRYPGNDIIDIASMDCYDKNDFSTELINNINLIINFAKANNKIPSIGEFGISDGIQNCDIDTWWMDDIYTPIWNDNTAYQLGYMNTWANFSPQKYWVPLPGNFTYQSFKQFSQQKEILFQNNIARSDSH